MLRESIRYFLIFVLLLITHVASAQVPLSPEISGDWWQIASVPELGYLTTERQEPVDFGIWQAADGTWQLWSCIRHTREPGKSRLFYGWEGRSLTDSNWQPMGIQMQANPLFGEIPGGLQAPYVIKLDNLYRMFYGNWQDICIAESTDGKRFTRKLFDGLTGLFTDGPHANTRDPMIIRHNNLWYCYYCAHRNEDGGIYCRTSEDFITVRTQVSCVESRHNKLVEL